MRRFLELIEARYLRLLPYILGAMTFVVCASFLAFAMLHIRLSRPTTDPISDTATIVVFETKKCTQICDQFRVQIGRPHQNSELAEKLPLRYFDVTDSSPPRRYQIARSIDGNTPTAIIFDIYGRERGRVDWLPRDLEDFQSRMLPHVRRAERDHEFAMSRAGEPGPR